MIKSLFPSFSVKTFENQISDAVTRLRSWWRRVLEFVFPPETDTWLAVLRIGLGLQVAAYTLFLRRDWHYLFASSGKGLVGRVVGEAVTSFDRPFVRRL